MNSCLRFVLLHVQTLNNNGLEATTLSFPFVVELLCPALYVITVTHSKLLYQESINNVNNILLILMCHHIYFKCAAFIHEIYNIKSGPFWYVYCVGHFCIDATASSGSVNGQLTLLHIWWWTRMHLDNEPFYTLIVCPGLEIKEYTQSPLKHELYVIYFMTIYSTQMPYPILILHLIMFYHILYFVTSPVQVQLKKLSN